VFGDGYRRPLDREKRARFRFLLNAHHRGGGLTRAARDVGEALVRRLGTDGRCDPAHATLAEDAGCCDRTVRRATGAMRDLGLRPKYTVGRISAKLSNRSRTGIR